LPSPAGRPPSFVGDVEAALENHAAAIAAPMPASPRARMSLGLGTGPFHLARFAVTAG
jgi:hypothetical protein